MKPEDLPPNTHLVINMVVGVEGADHDGGVVVTWVHDVIAHLNSDGTSPCGCNACELFDQFTDLAHRDGCIVPQVQEHASEVFMDVF